MTGWKAGSRSVWVDCSRTAGRRRDCEALGRGAAGNSWEDCDGIGALSLCAADSPPGGLEDMSSSFIPCSWAASSSSTALCIASNAGLDETTHANQPTTHQGDPTIFNHSHTTRTQTNAMPRMKYSSRDPSSCNRDTRIHGLSFVQVGSEASTTRHSTRLGRQLLTSSA